MLAVGGAGALVLARRSPGTRFPELVPGAVGAVVGLALAGSLRTVGLRRCRGSRSGLGLALLTAAVLVASRTAVAAGLVASGAALAGAHAVLMAEDERYGALALVALLAAVPATARRRCGCPCSGGRRPGRALLAPWAAVLLARADGLLSAVVGGLLLALLAALCFAVATLRAGRPEEWVAAAVGAVAGLTAGLLSSDVEAWGQVGIQLGIAGAAAGAYAVTAHRRWVGVVAVADLVRRVVDRRRRRRGGDARGVHRARPPWACW